MLRARVGQHTRSPYPSTPADLAASHTKYEAKYGHCVFHCHFRSQLPPLSFIFLTFFFAAIRLLDAVQPSTPATLGVRIRTLRLTSVIILESLISSRFSDGCVSNTHTHTRPHAAHTHTRTHCSPSILSTEPSTCPLLPRCISMVDHYKD